MRWKNFLYNIAFAVTCLLAFLLIFEGLLNVPVWLQVFGRIHPLFLHIPIGLLLLYAATEIFSLRHPDPSFTDFKDGLLLISSVTVSITALMGLFLSREEGYDPDAIALHKWSGTAISFLLLAWYQWRNVIRRKMVLNKIVALLSIVAITLTGHFGGEITHGQNYVLAPMKSGKLLPKIPMDEAIVFRDMVQPILKEKCLSCHNSEKMKGGLIMETEAQILKGGKNGKLWDTTDNELGLLVHRINLPGDNEDHMPPKRKPQLTETEKLIFKSWVRLGSNFKMKVSDLKDSDTLKAVAATMFSNGENETFTFAGADLKTIRSLNNFYRVVQPIADGSPALSVNFFGRSKFSPAAIKELSPVQKQVTEMDLSRMPVDDSHLKEISGFVNLRKLNLAFTNVKGNGLMALKGLKHLREISLSGTNVDVHTIDSLKKFPALKKVFVWNVPAVNPQVAALMKKDTGRVKFETGYKNDTLLLKLTPPIVRNEEFVLTEPTDLLLKHNINGAQIRYTLDGTEPDSIHSPLYNHDVRITQGVIVKSKVFRKGWISSDVQTVRFFFSKLKPKNVGLATKPNELYQASGGPSLFDHILGGTTNTSGNWLGFRYPQVFEATMDFDSAVHSKTITLSAFRDFDDDIFPPQAVTLWYSNEKDKWKKLKEIHPPVPTKKEENGGLTYVFNMPDEAVRYVKIRAVPSKRLPSWFSKKEKTGWIFLDEIIVN